MQSNAALYGSGVRGQRLRWRDEMATGGGVVTRKATRLKKRLERVEGETGVTHDAAHGQGIDWIVTRDSQDADAVSHNDVLSLAGDEDP